ncbi:hypothetical protein [Pantoea agglomerans]|jgi:hypothetical protein|uniref:hypothetical protein n=1 Tax=Enterobacter agglomerans TaxID=549 RepID=UPI00216569D0|nr:hypothetical protein [Pantoea agglomerans]MDN4624699.1 hypothetical protein [Pantoea agglomerans]UVV73644.1 hypothetical protein NYF24_04615 [Pantoea agglomerans]
MGDFMDFYELMDHEFKEVEVTPNKSGYVVDRQGIKLCCKFNTFKSVDYLYESNDKLHLIEFSDLAKHHIAVLQKIERFKECNLDKSLIRDNVKRLHREICNEIKTKYIHSLSILKSLPKHVENVPVWAQVDCGRLVIVVAPPPSDMDESGKQDVFRVLEKLKDDLTSSIPDEIFRGVKVQQVENFFS